MKGIPGHVFGCDGNAVKGIDLEVDAVEVDVPDRFGKLKNGFEFGAVSEQGAADEVSAEGFGCDLPCEKFRVKRCVNDIVDAVDGQQMDLDAVRFESIVDPDVGLVFSESIGEFG